MDRLKREVEPPAVEFAIIRVWFYGIAFLFAFLAVLGSAGCTRNEVATFVENRGGVDEHCNRDGSCMRGLVCARFQDDTSWNGFRHVCVVPEAP